MVYRFTYSPSFQKELIAFSQTHRFDDLSTFKEAWTLWNQENRIIFNLEKQALEQKGYKGDINIKMYKSVRYYYCNFQNKKSRKIHKKYVCLSNNYHKAVDNHLQSIEKYKPEISYKLFLENLTYQKIIQQEEKYMENLGISKTDISYKLKKNYKNRYYKKYDRR